MKGKLVNQARMLEGMPNPVASVLIREEVNSRRPGRLGTPVFLPVTANECKFYGRNSGCL